jgi:hypothetical protein
MMACAHCGASMPDAAARCLKCGVRVEGDVVGDVFRTVDRPIGPEAGPGRVLAVLIFAILLLTAAAVYLFY